MLRPKNVQKTKWFPVHKRTFSAYITLIFKKPLVRLLIPEIDYILLVLISIHDFLLYMHLPKSAATKPPYQMFPLLLHFEPHEILHSEQEVLSFSKKVAASLPAVPFDHFLSSLSSTILSVYICFILTNIGSSGNNISAF